MGYVVVVIAAECALMGVVVVVVVEATEVPTVVLVHNVSSITLDMVSGMLLSLMAAQRGGQGQSRTAFAEEPALSQNALKTAA